MQIVILFWTLMVGEIALFIYFLILSAKTEAKEKEEAPLTKEIEEPQILKLEAQIISLQDELEKTKTSYAAVVNEIQDLKKRKSDLNEELLKQKEMYGLEQKELDQLKMESSEFKKKLVSKDQELEKILTRAGAVEKELTKKTQVLQALEKENKEITTELRDLEVQIKKLEEEKEGQSKIIAEYKKKESLKVSVEEAMEMPSQLELAREQKKDKIGEILLANKLITKEMLDKALEYQAEFGGNITQYLLAYGYIDEGQLAQCLCTQFGVPYLPLSSYDISAEIIKMVPVDIVERYWLLPVDKLGSVLTIVMADPLNTQAIREVEEITGCKVQVFLGLLSEIIEALEGYYKIIIREKEPRTKRTLPFFIDTKIYKGPERRQSIRFKTKIDINFTEKGLYKISKTMDVSRDGFSFVSGSALPIGSLITLQIDLPKEFSPLPIAAVVQVVRVIPLENNQFEIGVKIIKISKEELNTILEYASSHREE